MPGLSGGDLSRAHIPGERQGGPPSQAAAAALARRLAGLPTMELLRAVIRDAFPGRVALVSSFGTESAVTLALAAEIDPDIPVLFLDTGKHFPETLAYRETLARRLGLTDLRSIEPDRTEILAEDPCGDLWRSDPDRCCEVRKVRPLVQALAPFDAWITGRKRYHGAARAALPPVEFAAGKIIISPLADWRPAQISAAFERLVLPRHPLQAAGYSSIGCAPCSHRASCEADPRAGRWAGLEKTECGIHKVPWARNRVTRRVPSHSPGARQPASAAMAPRASTPPVPGRATDG